LNKRIPKGIIPMPPPRLFKEGVGVINQKEIDKWNKNIKIILNRLKGNNRGKEC
jgi:hypothetical protein